MRSQGQVRFITITSRMQIAAASLVVAVIAGWSLSMGVMAVRQYQAEAARWSLLEREMSRPPRAGSPPIATTSAMSPGGSSNGRNSSRK